MVTVNRNYLKLPGSYLFSDIARKVNDFKQKNPNMNIIRLGIGDVTQPIAPAIIKTLHESVDEMANESTFKGYAPDLGYEFLRKTIADKDYLSRGTTVYADEIFVSDGAKSDCSAIQEIFGIENKIAVCDPVYPVYVDSNVMAGRTGGYNAEKGIYENVIYMPCTEENNFVPDFPKEKPDLIYLCYPNNPTGGTITKESLQAWVDHAVKIGAIILFDAAYEAYICDDEIPHSIYECEGARECAIEFRSFSKNAGFTGLRLGFTVIPKELKCDGVSLHSLWARRHSTRYNGAPYIIQKAGETVYSNEGQKQIKEQISYYMKNAKYIKNGLLDAGFKVYGGENAPYLWLKTPNNIKSWDFFDLLLNKAGVVGTPGVGFGKNGEGYFRLTAFGTLENSIEAIKRIKEL